MGELVRGNAPFTSDPLAVNCAATDGPESQGLFRHADNGPSNAHPRIRPSFRGIL
jgi:hypothetical protein